MRILNAATMFTERDMSIENEQDKEMGLAIVTGKKRIETPIVNDDDMEQEGEVTVEFVVMTISRMQRIRDVIREHHAAIHNYRLRIRRKGKPVRPSTSTEDDIDADEWNVMGVPLSPVVSLPVPEFIHQPVVGEIMNALMSITVGVFVDYANIGVDRIIPGYMPSAVISRIAIKATGSIIGDIATETLQNGWEAIMQRRAYVIAKVHESENPASNAMTLSKMIGKIFSIFISMAIKTLQQSIKPNIIKSVLSIIPKWKSLGITIRQPLSLGLDVWADYCSWWHNYEGDAVKEWYTYRDHTDYILDGLCASGLNAPVILRTGIIARKKNVFLNAMLKSSEGVIRPMSIIYRPPLVGAPGYEAMKMPLHLRYISDPLGRRIPVVHHTNRPMSFLGMPEGEISNDPLSEFTPSDDVEMENLQYEQRRYEYYKKEIRSLWNYGLGLPSGYISNIDRPNERDIQKLLNSNQIRQYTGDPVNALIGP